MKLQSQHQLQVSLSQTAQTPVEGLQFRTLLELKKNCYKNKRYRIICNKTAAFLQSIQQEVTDITLGDDINPGKIQINGPIISSGCPSQGPKTLAPFNLSGTPFLVSPLNKFTAVGCNNTMLMTNIKPEIVGCETTGDQTTGNNVDNGGGTAKCDGYKCCQVAIPTDFRYLELELKRKVEICAKLLSSPPRYFRHQIRAIPISWLPKKNIPMLLDWSPSWYKGSPYLRAGCVEDDLDACTSGFNPCGNLKYVSLGGRSFHCGDDLDTGYISLGSAIGFALLLLVGGIWGCCKCNERQKRKNLKRKLFKRNGGLLLQQQLSSADGSVEKTKILSSKELDRATYKFNQKRILGQGGQGTVYKGMLEDGRIFSVKKSKVVDEDKLEEFINEVVILL